MKNANWALNYYQSPESMNRTINGFIDQARIYQSHNALVTFAFNGSVPDVVQAALEAMGVIV